MITVNKPMVRLRPIVGEINMPTVLKSAILPGDAMESLFIATQTGEIYYLRNGAIGIFADIRDRLLQIGGTGGGYDERGLLGLAFHPAFNHNGLFYIHYSVSGSQGPGALSGPFRPNPCDPGTLNLKWTNRETQFDHIDTVEEWMLANGQPRRRRTLLALRRPFLNHNGVNSLNFSPETGNLVLATGDGGSGFDPFNLSQDRMEIAGKIVEIDVSKHTHYDNQTVVTRFDELPVPVQETLTVMAKGVRNIPGIAFQWWNCRYIKYAGVVGQDLVESIYSFIRYRPIPVIRLVQASFPNDEGLINFGWRGWEGALPTTALHACSAHPAANEKTVAYYDEAVETSAKRIPPLTSYFHEDPRSDKFAGTALTGVQPYMGLEIPGLTGSVLFTDLARKEQSRPPVRGVLAYTRPRFDGRPNDYRIVDTDDPFGSQSAYYVSMGTNLKQTKVYIGVYGSMKVADVRLGTVCEIVPATS